MQLILPKSSQKWLLHQLASPDIQDPINLNHEPTLHIHHKKNMMLLWNLPAPLKAAISNGFFSLKSKISAFNVHLKIIKIKNVMLLKKEEEELFLKTYKITTQNSSL